MPRRNQTNEKRRELLPIVARAFAERGYRRTTTAELAERCGVQENILYRLWPDKKAMFIAAIGYVYDLSVAIWSRLLKEADGKQTAAERLLAYEAEHLGEFGHSRIVFAGLSETDDPDIQAALAAWAVVGLGTVASISRELGLLSDRQRRRLMAEIGRLLLEGPAA